MVNKKNDEMLTNKVAGEMEKKKAMDLIDMKMIKSSIKCNR